MSEIPNNPFLEGSVQIPDEEVEVIAKALAEEAANIRAKADDIKEKAAKARAKKEAARKMELARIEAEVAAAREQVIKTVSSIPKASEKSTVRPAPPPESEAAVLSSGQIVTTKSGKFYLSNEPVGMLNLAADIAIVLTTVLFTFLIFQEM